MVLSTMDETLNTDIADEDGVPEALALFSAAVERYPLLSDAEEITLGLCIMEGACAAEALQHVRGLDIYQRMRLQRLVAAAADARLTLIASNLRLVIDVGLRYRSSTVPLLDLIQEGTLGLMHAVDIFDWRVGARFGTMARWHIRSSIGPLARQRSRTIRRSSLMQRRHSTVLHLCAALEQTLGRTATPTELATASGMSLHDLAMLEQSMSPETSLDAPPSDGENTLVPYVFAELIDPQATPEDQVLARERTAAIAEAMATLAPRTREMLAWRYGYKDGVPHTTSDIARRFHISRERTRQVLLNGEARLRTKLAVSLDAVVAA